MPSYIQDGTGARYNLVEVTASNELMVKVGNASAIGSAPELLTAIINQAIAGTSTLVAAVGGQKIRVYGFMVHNNDSTDTNDQTFYLLDGAAHLHGAANNGIYLVGDGGAFGIAPTGAILWTLTVNTALRMTIDDSFKTSGVVWYTQGV